MRVFNLTEKPIDYRGRTIEPNGGFVDFPGVSFVPDRDQDLQSKRVLAFDKLPKWFETHLKLKQLVQAADKFVERAEAQEYHTPEPEPEVSHVEDQEVVEAPRPSKKKRK